MGLLGALMLASIVWGLHFAADPRRMPIRAVRVEGELRYLSRESLEQAVASQIGQGFFRIDLGALRQAAMELPWVRAVSVRRQWPDRLVITVQERQAAARWAAGGLVDSEGVLFRPPQDRYPAGLPELSGPVGAQALLLRRYREFSDWLSPGGLEIRQVSLDARGAWRLKLDGGMVLVLGQEPSEQGVRRFVRALPAIRAERGEAIEQVDLRYPNGFALRWGPKPDTGDKGK